MAERPKEEEVDESFKLYPERRSNRSEYTPWERLFSFRGDTEQCRIICELNVKKAFNENPILKILRGALKNAGCPLTLNRNVVCEECASNVEGGFDSEYQQIVVCKNSRKARNNPEVILYHELIHMYDYCVNEVNFKNLDHLACTEIRAANLSHCSFLSSLFLKQSSFFNIKKTHQYCVMWKAASSIVAARNIDFPTAVKHVLKVFDKCYNDLEPVGRRIRRNSPHPVLAYEEAKHFGICDP